MRKILAILLAVLFVTSLTAVSAGAMFPQRHFGNHFGNHFGGGFGGGWGGWGGWGWPYMGYGYGWPYMGSGYGYPATMVAQPPMEQPVVKEVVKEVVCCPPNYVKKYVK